MARKNTGGAVAFAALAGLGAFVLFGRKAKAKKKAGPTPEPEEPEEPGEPPTEPPQPPDVKKDAPPYAFDVVTQYAVETATANVYIGRFLGAVNRAAMNMGYTDDPEAVDVLTFLEDPELRDAAKQMYGIPSGRTIASYLTDETFFDVYPQAGKIPAQQNRGTGWSPYINAWKRIWDYTKDQLGVLD